MLPGSEELTPGLHRWVTFYPGWGHDVASIVIEDEQAVVLVDPLAPAGVREARAFWRALDARARTASRVDVVVTLHYHRRSAPDVARRYHASLWAPGGSVERLGTSVDRPFEPGALLPAGLTALASGRDDEVVLWHPRTAAVISGDVLLGGVRKPYRVCPPSWLPAGVTRSDVAAALAPLRELPVKLLVPTHGPPVTTGARDALAAALEEASSPGKQGPSR